MGFGAYDEDEHERREAINQRVLSDEDDETDDRTHHDGEITYEGEEDTDELLARLSEMKSE